MTEEELFKKFQKHDVPKEYIHKEDCLFFITEAIRNNFIILGSANIFITKTSQC